MDDYISKHEAYTKLKDLEAAYIYPPIKEAYATAARRVDEIKAADVQPVKRGKWCGYLCSECNEYADYFISGNFYFDEKPNFCPNCGAKNNKGGDY